MKGMERTDNPYPKCSICGVYWGTGAWYDDSTWVCCNCTGEGGT